MGKERCRAGVQVVQIQAARSTFQGVVCESSEHEKIRQEELNAVALAMFIVDFVWLRGSMGVERYGCMISGGVWPANDLEEIPPEGRSCKFLFEELFSGGNGLGLTPSNHPHPIGMHLPSDTKLLRK